MLSCPDPEEEEGGPLGLLIAISSGIFGGRMNKLLGMHAGVQFMA